ncbi:MAG: DsbA family protein [Pseudomonadota bacterium]
MNKLLAIGALCASVGIAALAFSGFTRGTAGEPQNNASGAFDNKQRNEINKLVEDYIKDNPKVILDSLYAFEKDQRAEDDARRSAALEDAVPYLASNNGAFAAGADVDNANIAVIEFFDYHCGFCKKAKGLIADLSKDDPAVKVVFRELPILRPESETAARYALAARDQGKYLDLHFAFLDASGTLNEERILDIASREGLDVAKLKSAVASPKLDEELSEISDIAKEIGVDGTPGFIVANVDGSFVKFIGGFQPEAVREAIKNAKKAG